MSKGSIVVAILIALAGGFAIGHLTGRDSEEDLEALDIDDEGGGGEARFAVPVTAAQPSKGPADALVTIVVFSDFECPYCSRVVPTLEQINKEYGDKVRVVWRNNPLPMHPNAKPAAKAALEANAQGGSAKFWKMHDLLFANQRSLTRDNLRNFAKQLGLDLGRFDQALDGTTYNSAIDADQALAAKLDAGGTPNFFINGRKLEGAQPFPQFKKVIDEEIVYAQGLIKKGASKKNLYATIIKNAKEGGAAEQPKDAPERPERPGEPNPNTVYKVPVGDSVQKGPADALVTIVQISDFECPFCGRVEPTIKQITEKYGNKVRVVWKNNPLPMHANAMPAAEAALEANAQGGAKKFWAMHELIFTDQRGINRTSLEGYATKLGLNLAKFKQALDNHTHKAKVEAEQAMAIKLGAGGTPAFFINGRFLSGAQPLQSFETLIDQELKKAEEKVKAGTPKNKLYDEIMKDAAESPSAAANAAPSEPEAPQKFNIPVPAKAPRKGAKKAKVVIQEFSDFQCPYCSRVSPTMQQIMSEYGDKVQVVWRNFPLPMHPNAQPAAEAAMEVYTQKGDAKFWAYHDLLFANQGALSRADLEKYAEQVGGINMANFRKALDQGTHKQSVTADMNALQQSGAQPSTPSFFVNDQLVQGAQPFPAFKAAIDRALAQ